VILYSMVATPTHDSLNYIFPMNLMNAEGARRRRDQVPAAQRRLLARQGMHSLRVVQAHRALLRVGQSCAPAFSPPFNRDLIELRSQFRICDYLRQLDPSISTRAIAWTSC